MSGGYFGYSQYAFGIIAGIINNKVLLNDSLALDDFGDRVGHGFSKETLKEMRKAVKTLRRAKVYADRIDWLLSGDDSEQYFHAQLKHEMEQLR